MATKGVRCSYQEVIDLHTESGHATAIGIHTPTGDVPKKMFSGFFDMYKKYKYLGCSIKFVPAARLPADPSQVSYGAGEPPIDPRDLMNPIMFHGCHGDDMGVILNGLYGDDNGISDSLVGIDVDSTTVSTNSLLYDFMERLYYKALTDKTWKKANPQRGFMKGHLRPLVYSVASNRQISPTAQIDNIMGIDNDTFDFEGGDPLSGFDFDTPGSASSVNHPTTQGNIQFFTPRLTSLGWMDTRSVITVPSGSVALSGTDDEILGVLQDAIKSQINYTELPKIFMGMILLAPAYKTELYFRVIINHYFAFKNFRGISLRPEVSGVPSYYNANDDLFVPDTFDDLGNSDGSGTDPDTPTPSVAPLASIAVTYKRGVSSGSATDISAPQIVANGVTLTIGGGTKSLGASAGSEQIWIESSNIEGNYRVGDVVTVQFYNGSYEAAKTTFTVDSSTVSKTLVYTSGSTMTQGTWS